ncbi:MAG: hypothetical protein J6Y70_00380 [Bacilli bacterium]|nr:hypothetical protein [Bacilli bacterium]
MENVKKIVVIGVGNAGKNVINYMQSLYSNNSLSDIYKNGIVLYIIDTDKNSISESKIQNNIFLSSQNNKDLDSGTAANRELAINIAEENKEKIRSIVCDFDIIFVISGIGGGTGGAVANVITDICKEENKISILEVFRPFEFENNQKKENFIFFLKKIHQNANAISVVSNEKLVSLNNNDSVTQVFEKSFKIAFSHIKTILDLLLFKQGIISISFLDIKNFLGNSNFIIISNAFGYDQTKLSDAIDDAIFSDLLNLNMGDAKKIICLITCHNDIFFNNIRNCLEMIYDRIGKIDSKLVVLNDKNLKSGEINVSVIGNYFDESATNVYFNDEKDPIKIKNIINSIDNIIEKNKNEDISENDILPFFIKNPSNKYGSKK